MPAWMATARQSVRWRRFEPTHLVELHVQRTCDTLRRYVTPKEKTSRTRKVLGQHTKEPRQGESATASQSTAAPGIVSENR